MHTYFLVGLSVLKGGSHARQFFIRRIVGLVVTFVFTGASLPGFHSAPAYNAQTKRPADKQQRSRKSAKSAPAYDCAGNLPQQPSEAGQRYIEQAIEDALEILRNCESCRRVFHERDPNYAIRLLEKLRRDRVFIMSAETPLRFSLIGSRNRLWVKETNKLNDSAAGTVDLLEARDPKPGEPMIKPCVYINPNGFVVTGKRAEQFGLYRLKPSVQRALAILHELGHVARVLQPDDGESTESRNKSVQSTNCLRLNCTSCQQKEFDACPGGTPSGKKQVPTSLHALPLDFQIITSPGLRRIDQ